MSVINKMLRDLDQRHAPAHTTSNPAVRQHLRGTASLAAAPPPARSGVAQRSVYGTALAISLLVLGGVGFWWWQTGRTLGAVPAASLAVTVADPVVPVVMSAPVAATGPHAVASAAAVKAVAPALTNTLPASAAPLPANPRSTAAPALAAKAQPAAAPMQAMVGSTAVASLATPLANSAAAAPAGSDAASNTLRQLQAGREALAQAQSLWAAGSHDAATELLQQAMSVVERSGGVGSAASLALLSSLVRELGRMHLAEGRAAATLDLLTRLEPALGRDADIWALRGNAAQRLGRHQDSVRAYAAALQLRPNEARWMLGSAVSLAALGQTAQATEMADKARTLGPISKEVQAYLRQAGVLINEP